MELNHVFPKRKEFNDFFPVYIGKQACEPGHSYGPSVREYVIIHYVKSGKGVLYSKGSEFHVSAGEAFVILPGEVTTYTADESDPWNYYWLCFGGTLSERFAELPSPVIKADGNIFTDPVDGIGTEKASTEAVIAKLFVLYGELFSKNSSDLPGVSPVKSAIRYIRLNYMNPNFGVDDVAKTVNLDRRYLTRLFKRETGLSVQPYILKVRCDRAREFLADGFNVRQTAAMVGYNDSYTFSKMYKRVTGKPPTGKTLHK